MSQPKLLARTAGIFYLLMAVLGGYAHLGVRAGVHVPGDAAASAQNVAANPPLFRFALVADITMAVAFVMVGVLLFLVFRSVDRGVASVLVVFVAVGAGMILTNLLLHQAALLVATDPTFGPVASDELVLLLLDLHQVGYTIAGVFFGLWLLPLGYLASRSGSFPRPLSVLVMVAGAAWIVATLVTFLVPAVPGVVSIIKVVPNVAEVWLIAYLLVWGVRAPIAGQPTPSSARP